jgi:hypothetical protein
LPYLLTFQMTSQIMQPQHLAPICDFPHAKILAVNIPVIFS